MLIEVFYVPGCPNHAPTVAAVRLALDAQSVNAEIREILVNDDATAQAIKFAGSPSVRINGVDAEPSNAQSFGLSCRIYAGGSGVPPQATLRCAIEAARRREVEV